MQWKYNGNLVEEIADQYIGFVYIITNLTNNKKYIGKKLAKFKKTRPPLKGKKRKRKSLVESDWQTYWGSSEHLLADVAELGTENFSREIVYFCTTRGELSYREAKEQFDREVLLTDEYYNGIINVRIGGSQALKESLKNNIPPL